jgi:hypothetical protein
MASKAGDKFAQRYLGDPDAKIVHDLDHEDPTSTGCAIDALIAAGAAMRFEPDRLRQAAEEGYNNCPKCLYRYDTRRGLLQQLLYEPLKAQLRKGKRGPEGSAGGNPQ